MTEVKRKIRCAVYTRKSHEEGLEQEFNSLDAQREAGEAYVTAQKHEGWVLVPDQYDDGGFSGGTLERPALKRLMVDIENDRIDVVVVYKIDRLTRSLLDFAHLIEVFEKHKASFVSVTQQFNTTTSMGRLILNVLLSFAQFEREVTGERIRDKLAASKRKGMWMGGVPPLGYDVVDRKLIINPAEAAIVRGIFERFVLLRSITAVTLETRSKGVRTKTYTTQKGVLRQGILMDKGFLYRLVSNPLYLGKIVHKDKIYEGQHQSIVPQLLWDEAHDILKVSPRTRGNESRREISAPLRGILKCAGCHSGMIATSTRRRGKLYRYYTSNAHMKKSCDHCPVGSLGAGEIEDIVLAQIQNLLMAPETIVAAWSAARASDPMISEQAVRQKLGNLRNLWDQLFPAEQHRLMRLLLQEAIVATDGIELVLNPNGLADFAMALFPPISEMEAA